MRTARWPAAVAITSSVRGRCPLDCCGPWSGQVRQAFTPLSRGGADDPKPCPTEAFKRRAIVSGSVRRNSLSTRASRGWLEFQDLALDPDPDLPAARGHRDWDVRLVVDPRHGHPS